MSETEKRIYADCLKFGTPKLSPIFSMFSEFSNGNSLMVP